MTHEHGHDAELITTDLTFAYPGCAPILDRLSFRLESGERLGLVGPNGSGKTTLLLALAGLLPATGTRVLDGEALPASEPDGAHVGMVFQSADDMLFMPTVLEDVAFGPQNLGQSPDEAEGTARRQLERLGIGDLADHNGLRLSGGQQRLAALATVLAMEPPVLLLDEPTANLDRDGRGRLLGILRELPGSLIMATHDLDSIRRVCTRAVRLEGGRIVAEGPVDDVLPR